MNSPCERAEEDALTADALKTNALNSDLTSRPTKDLLSAVSESEDRALLVLAAKADGTVYEDASVQSTMYGGPVLLRPYGGLNFQWDPLIDDEDAFRLAVTLGLEVKVTPVGAIVVPHAGGEVAVTWTDSDENNNDHFAATRRAIVRCAAALGAACEAVSGEQPSNGKEVLPSGDAR